MCNCDVFACFNFLFVFILDCLVPYPLWVWRVGDQQLVQFLLSDSPSKIRKIGFEKLEGASEKNE